CTHRSKNMGDLPQVRLAPGESHDYPPLDLIYMCPTLEEEREDPTGNWTLQSQFTGLSKCRRDNVCFLFNSNVCQDSLSSITYFFAPVPPNIICVRPANISSTTTFAGDKKC